MDEAVRTGKPLRHRASFSDDQRREAFLMGMYNMASQQAPQIALAIDLKKRRKLLDLGGGPGTYAIHFCKQNKDLKAVVVDLPTTRPFAEKIIAQHGLSRRIAFVPGNYISEEIGGRYDVAWLSHILHAEGPGTCDRILRKVVRAMMPGAIILIHDFILNQNMDGPLFPALFALNMLQGTEQGQSYSQSQIREMLQNAGVRDIERLDYVGPTESGIMMGTVVA
jgi:cyclopropane fatty-acyl-phospholipid synthase-like methyltransferase